LRPSERNGGTRPQLTAEQVCHQHAARIYRLARRLLNHDADAEDITQEVLLQVVRKLDTFRHESELTTWLHRVTVNAALAHRRSSACHSARQISEPMERLLEEDTRMASLCLNMPQPSQQVLDQESQALVEQAVAALPPMYRDVYLLAGVEGLPVTEIAALLELSVQAVKSRLHRARLLLRAAIAPHFETGLAGRAVPEDGMRGPTTQGAILIGRPQMPE
jgi:RNA polymerase sigma-70 factor (ECF subfamily)